MSPDLERRLREARETLPEPDAAATAGARERAVAVVGRSRTRRVPPAVAVAAALLTAVLVGVVIGASTAPTVTASRGPIGLGFLPERGWYALHARGGPVDGAQAVATASNVPFDPSDDLDGLAEASGLPYETLLSLPPDGIVLVAVAIRGYELLLPSSGIGPSDELPLQLRDADWFVPFSAQIRPEQPLGQYHIAANVQEYNVTVDAYFGRQRPTEGMLAEAQRQLDRLVVAPEPKSKGTSPLGRAMPSAARIVTLAVQQWYDKPSKTQKTRFTGTVSSGAAGEDVTVMQQVCGYRFGTSVAGTQTGAGGFWQAEPANAYVIAPSATYRARWGSETSTPVVIRPKIPVYLIPVGKGRLHFTLSIGSVYQNMLGKTVVLERLWKKKWTIVQQRKLTFDTGSPNGTYNARFAVKRGWTVRARAPGKIAAPCFKPAATPKVKVG